MGGEGGGFLLVSMKKIFRWALIYLLLVIGLFLILVGVNWYLIKQKEVRLGMARPKFPYTKYSQDELDKMYPQYYEVKVPTRQTPEQTYSKFIAALKVGNLEEASIYFFARNIDDYPVNYKLDESKQKEWLASLQKIKQDGLMEKMINDLDKTLNNVSVSDISAQYEIGIKKDGKVWAHTISFMKDIDGDWKIKSL
jgi:hypothetical protein